MQKIRHFEHEQELLRQKRTGTDVMDFEMMILTDTDFKATVLNMLKEIGNDLKLDARNKNCKK